MNWSLACAERSRSIIGHWSLRRGFTLVELIVSVAITAVLMLGMSVFFSSTFHNLFQAQRQGENIQMQFAVNEIIRDKFNNMDALVQNNGDSIVALNKNTKNQLPFSYIGKADIEGKNYLAFKDLMIFNGVLGTSFSNTGAGKIDGPANITNLNNPAGFTYLDSKSRYYIAIPSENKIMVCAQGASDCTAELNLGDYELNMPIDVEKYNDDTLFISDSGNGRVLKVKLASDITASAVIISASGLNYPTGLTYYNYNDGVLHYMFIADTFNHKIKRINSNLDDANQDAITVIGDGESTACDNTAQFCKLNYPTGLVADANTNSLYIADSGNDRILRMYDPITSTEMHLSFEPGGNYALKKIQFLNNDWVAGNYDENQSNLIGKANPHYSGKTFENTQRLTTYVGNDCSPAANSFHVNEDLVNDIDYLDGGDKLRITEDVYTINSFSLVDCDLADPDNTINKYKITVDEDNADTIGNNQIVYFSNQDTVEVFFNGVSYKDPNDPQNPLENKTGFQTFEITTYDLFEGLVSTNYHVERIGNGILGTMEDAIEVVEDGLNFPTGVGLSGVTVYYADSLNNKFQPANKDLNPIGTADFSVTAENSDFDYISDFIVSSLAFATKNAGKILEMTLEAYTDNMEESYVTYIINAAFPAP